MESIPINLAVEDPLSEAVLRAILRQSNRPYAVGTCYCQGGYGYLKKTIRRFNNAAKGTPFLVLTDLDKADCPPGLIQAWLPDPKHPNLLFRIAVREVEAWILAHREAFALFAGVQQELIPQDVDALDDPKRSLAVSPGSAIRTTRGTQDRNCEQVEKPAIARGDRPSTSQHCQNRSGLQRTVNYFC